MTERRIKRTLALLLTLCLAIPLNVALADREDVAEMAAYWRIVGSTSQTDPLTRAMNGDYTGLSQPEKSAALAELRAVTADELLSFAANNKLPISMARHAVHTALADCLTADIAQHTPTKTEEMLSLFLDMRTNTRDKTANEERRALRNGMSLNGRMATTGAKAGATGISLIGWMKATCVINTAGKLLLQTTMWSGCSGRMGIGLTTDVQERLSGLRAGQPSPYLQKATRLAESLFVCNYSSGCGPGSGCQPLHTSTQHSARECVSSSGMVSSMALLLLPQAGNTVVNRLRDSSR